jgi:hypothetical protein
LIRLSPSSLRAYLACPRSWYLSFVLRAEREVPAYVTAGTGLDEEVQQYLQTGRNGSDELTVAKKHLPHPGTVLVQPELDVPCPGLEGRVRLSGKLDYMTPPNLDLMVIGDLKRVWHNDAAHTPESLANDIQAQFYAWLVYQLHAPRQVNLAWTYLVRASVPRDPTKTKPRPAQAFMVAAQAEKQHLDDWIERVVLPAARGMLEIIDRASQHAARHGMGDAVVRGVEHDPESCESGARCFVRAHCPMFQGPIKGEKESLIMDLSKFAIGRRDAINPPAPSVAPEVKAVLVGAVEPASLGTAKITRFADGTEKVVFTANKEIDAVIETTGEAVPSERPTEPAPPPERTTWDEQQRLYDASPLLHLHPAAEDWRRGEPAPYGAPTLAPLPETAAVQESKQRKRRTTASLKADRKQERRDAIEAEHDTAREAEKQELPSPLADLALDAASLSTEQLTEALNARGYRVYLEKGPAL